MLQKNDLVLLLTQLSEEGDKNADKYIRDVLVSPQISLDVLKYINEVRPLNVTAFYDGLRKSYNNKKSSLYKNIVRDSEDPNEIIAALHSFALQLFLYSKKLTETDKLVFYKHVRAEEITRVLNKFYKEYDIDSAFKLIRLLKADLVAFETIAGRR